MQGRELAENEHHLEFLGLKEAAEARPSLHLSKCHIVVNHMSRLNCLIRTFACYSARSDILTLYMYIFTI